VHFLKVAVLSTFGGFWGHLGRGDGPFPLWWRWTSRVMRGHVRRCMWACVGRA
jgi:hypothetical protein